MKTKMTTPSNHPVGRRAFAALLLALAVWQPLPAAASCSSPFFSPQTAFGVGDGPFSVAVGDFNGDGALDLAVANSLANNVSVLLGNGSGGFGPQTTFAVGQAPLPPSPQGISTAMARWTWPWRTKRTITSRCCWATATAALARRRPSPSGAGLSPSPWGISTATAGWTWPSPTLTTTTSRCCWATATAASAPQRLRRRGRDPVSVAVGDFNGDGRRPGRRQL